MARRRHLLVLLPDTAHHAPGDFEEIARLVHAECEDVRVRVRSPEAWRRERWRHPLRPVTVVALRHWGPRIRPLRGLCFQGVPHGKADQYRRMEEAGVPTIPWRPWTPDTRPDPAVFGPYVVTKPDVGSRGRDVKLRATGRLRYDARKHGGERWLVQRFVHTGPHPVVHRVLTLFGRPLLHVRSELVQAKPCHDPGDPQQVAGHNPVASSRRARVELARDAEIESYAADFARRVYPEVPVLGLDVLREAADGALYCCECNPWGQSWHFSSELGRRVQREHGLDFAGQLDAFRTAAEALIGVARGAPA